MGSTDFSHTFQLQINHFSSLVLEQQDVEKTLVVAEEKPGAIGIDASVRHNGGGRRGDRTNSPWAIKVSNRLLTDDEHTT